MAIMHFAVKPVSRARGSSAVSRAAYISRDKLRDERAHRAYDFRERGGLEHSEILKPSAAGQERSAWTADRATLWNHAEKAETRRDARVAREYVVALPHELGAKERLALAREFAQSIADRYGGVVDLAVHRPTAQGDQRNHHAHVLSTTREWTPNGPGRKTAMELSDDSRRSRGLPRGREEIRQLRHDWAERVNVKLKEAELEVRVDARSLWEQGSNRVPQVHLSPAMIAIERAGGRSFAAERLREEHAAREQAMRHYAQGPTIDAARPASVAGVHHAPVERPAALGVDELRRQAAQRWLEYRQQLAAGQVPAATAERTRLLDRGLDHGL